MQGFLPNLHGQLISVKYPERTAGRSLEYNGVRMRLDQLLILAKLRGVQFWSSVNVYVHQETKGGLFTRSTLPSGQPQSFSPNHSVEETADYFNLLKLKLTV